LPGDSGTLGTELEIEKNKTESESESSDDGICCGAENRALVEDLETIEPESETDNDNPESESEMSGGGVTPYKCLGKISDILHLNNENNQLER